MTARTIQRSATNPARTLPGSAFPLGATVRDDGTNFAVAAGAADSLLLCLFDENGAENQVPLLDYDAGVWHGFVPRVTAGQAYGYRAAGRYDPGAGLRYNPAKLLLDPGDPSRYVDTTGCGNSLNVGDPLTLQLIMDSLRYWVTQMHVDGFRFDLAPNGSPKADPSHRNLSANSSHRLATVTSICSASTRSDKPSSIGAIWSTSAGQAVAERPAWRSNQVLIVSRSSTEVTPGAAQAAATAAFRSDNERTVPLSATAPSDDVTTTASASSFAFRVNA